jgi:hypothetical protein
VCISRRIDCNGADLFGNGNPGRAFFAYVDFQHVHLLSDDPVGTTELPLPARDPRVVNVLQVFPMVSTRMDNVNMICE